MSMICTYFYFNHFKSTHNAMWSLGDTTDGRPVYALSSSLLGIGIICSTVK